MRYLLAPVFLYYRYTRLDSVNDSNKWLSIDYTGHSVAMFVQHFLDDSTNPSQTPNPPWECDLVAPHKNTPYDVRHNASLNSSFYTLIYIVESGSVDFAGVRWSLMFWTIGFLQAHPRLRLVSNREQLQQNNIANCCWQADTSHINNILNTWINSVPC